MSPKRSIQWNLLKRTPLGPAVLSFVERLSSFRGDFLWSVYVYKSTFGLSFVERFVLFWSVLYRRFHCSYSDALVRYRLELSYGEWGQGETS